MDVSPVVMFLHDNDDCFAHIYISLGQSSFIHSFINGNIVIDAIGTSTARERRQKIPLHQIESLYTPSNSPSSTRTYDENNRLTHFIECQAPSKSSNCIINNKQDGTNTLLPQPPLRPLHSLRFHTRSSRGTRRASQSSSSGRSSTSR